MPSPVAEDIPALIAETEAALVAGHRTEASELHSRVARALAALPGADGAAAGISSALRAQHEGQRGVLALAADDAPTAVEAFEAALKLEPALHITRANLGIAQLRAGDTEAALAALRAALGALGPLDPAAIGALDAVIDAGHGAEAQGLAEALLVEHPDVPGLIFVQGRAFAATQRFDAAARAFARVAELQPALEGAPINEARARLALGDEAGAAAVLRAALERFPDSRLVKQRLAWLLATARSDEVADGARAVELAKAVLAVNPKHPEFLTLAAAAFAASGDFQAARTHEGIAIEQLKAMSADAAPLRRPELLEAMEARLALYRTDQRWREAPPTPH
ncbi:MAG: tetratricopeptide repeat protein [Planctomycetota bacterium]